MLNRKKSVVAAILATGTVGLVGGGAISAAQIASEGSNEPTPADRTPKPETKRISATAASPAGGPAWAVELSESKSGGICMAVNRTQNDRLVLVTPEGQVKERTAPPEGNCGKFPAKPTAKEHTRSGIVAQNGDIVFYGVADDQVKSVSLVRPNGTSEPLALSPERTFISVHRGAPVGDPLRYGLVVTLNDGTTVKH